VHVLFDLRETPAIMVGAAQLETALLNLMINARDATPDGGEIRVALTTREIGKSEAKELGLLRGLHVSLSVQDFGVGMTEDVKDRVFEPFYTTKPVGRGTGLGLSTVRSVAQKFGGAVRLESAPERGTTVELLFPGISSP
jgi:signal transduction histidine kinase